MNSILSEYNGKIRNGKRIIHTDYIIRKRGKLLHICLNSIGCRFRHSGSCIMCDYGQGRALTEAELENVFPAIEEKLSGIESILIGTLGSVLDPEEISLESLERICRFLRSVSIHTIIFETHYIFINEKVCKWLKEQLPGKDIVVEVGLETIDKFVQKECWNKVIDLVALNEKIKILHSFNFSITANLLLGAPFLTVSEQIQDVENSVLWSIKNGVDSVAIFPVNIREHTFLNVLFREGQYVPIQQWAVFEVLCRIPTFYLNRVHLAWYGDWIEYDEEGRRNNIPPSSCRICEPKWMEFYAKFMEEENSNERKNLIKKYRKFLKKDCDCHANFLESLVKSFEIDREKRISDIKSKLIKIEP